MASPQDLPRQVRQNKKDVNELYKLSKKTNNKVKVIATKVKVIANVQQEHGERLDHIEGRLDGVETTQGEHGTKLDEILGILKAP